MDRPAALAPLAVDPRTASCACSADHRPNPLVLHAHHVWPLYLGGPDVKANLVTLCPTAHTSVHILLDAWARRGERPDARPLGTPLYVWKIAVLGFERWQRGRLEW